MNLKYFSLFASSIFGIFIVRTINKNAKKHCEYMIVTIISHKTPLVNHFNYEQFTKFTKNAKKINFWASIPNFTHKRGKVRRIFHEIVRLAKTQQGAAASGKLAAARGHKVTRISRFLCDFRMTMHLH